jgi:predicted Zn finger-like uncharacterized protein
MLIVCPNCATSYDVEVASLRPNGRRVRCVRCRTIWQAELSHADKLVAAADALGPVRRTVEAAAAAARGRPAIPPSERFEAGRDVAPGGFGLSEDDDSPGFSASADEAARNDFPEIESPPTAPEDFDAGGVPNGLHADMHADMDANMGADLGADLDATEYAAADVRPMPAEIDAAKPPADFKSSAARVLERIKPMGLGWSLSLQQWGILALIILDAIVIGWRTDFVRFMPQTASFYAAIGLPVNLRGLAFTGVTTTTEQHEGVPILVVEGTIVNETRKLTDMPHLRFAIRNAAHQEVYSWIATPPRSMLASGEAVPFHTRLASPPPDAHDVLVRFLNRYDVMNGAR